MKYRKVASSNTFRLKAHAGFFRLLMKGIFDPYILGPFDKKMFFEFVTRVNTRDHSCSVSRETTDVTVTRGMLWSVKV